MIESYGKSFQDEKALNAYKGMMADRRKRAIARKMQMSSQEKEDASVRAHFAKEAKHFKI